MGLLKMRILILILVTLAVCWGKEKNSTTTTKAPASTTKKIVSTKTPGEARGKRTLYSFGNPGFQQQQQQQGNSRHFQRRISSGYHEPRAYFSSPEGYYNPQNGNPYNYVPDASNHLPDHSYYQPHYQPQYLEAPEPIIEIIIKESNETLPPPEIPQYVQKKKKEQVQVFYVKYKKDEHNKLHLDSPIPALSPLPYHQSNDEEEEIIEQPIIVTPLPPLKTTTLRTIIHPDSEKFHSNSGVHVSFGTEDKHQAGHQLQEHNEESAVQSVVALPPPANFVTHPPSAPFPSQQPNFNDDEKRFSQHYRSDFGQEQSRTISNSFGEQNFKGPFPPPPPHIQSYVNQQQQLPYPQQPAQSFRQFNSHHQYVPYQQSPQESAQENLRQLLRQPPQQSVHQPTNQQSGRQSQHHGPQQQDQQSSHQSLQQEPQLENQQSSHQSSQQESHQQSTHQSQQQLSRPQNQQSSHQSQQQVPHQQNQPLSHQSYEQNSHHPPQQQNHQFSHKPPQQPINHQRQSSHHSSQQQSHKSHQQSSHQPPQHPIHHHQQHLQYQHQSPPATPASSNQYQSFGHHFPRNPQNFNEQSPSGPTSNPIKHPVRFPPPGTSQTSFKSNFEYQVKHRPAQGPQHKPIPIPLHNIDSENQHQSYNRPPPFGPPAHAPPPQFQQQLENEEHFAKIAHEQQFRQKPSSPPRPANRPPPQSKPHSAQESTQQGPVFNQNNRGQSFQPNQQVPAHHQQQPHSPFAPQFEHSSQQVPSHNNQQPQSQSQSESNKYFPQNPTLVNGGLVQQTAPNLGSFPSQDGHSQQELINGLVPNSELVKSVPRFEQHITETVNNNNQPNGQRFNEQKSETNNKLAFNEFSSQSNQNVIQNIPAPHLGPSTPSPNFDQPSHSPRFGPTEFPNFSFSSTPTPQFNNFVSQQPQFLSSTAGPQYNTIPSSTPEPQFYRQNNEHIQLVTPVAPSGSGQNFNHNQEYIRYDHNIGAQPQIIPNSDPRPHIQQNVPSPGQHVSTLHTAAFSELEQRQREYLAQQHAINQQQQQQLLLQQQQQQQQQQHEQHQNHQNFYNHQNGNNQDQNVVEITGRNNKYSVQQTVSVTQLPKNHRFGPLNPSTTPSPTTSSTTTTRKPESTGVKMPAKTNIELPDEVPDELRQQLLSSGILDNADISVLDYDKIGDVALENLPPEHLQHFYGAGGGSQISESNKILTVVKPNGDKVDFSEKFLDKSKSTLTLPKRQNVDLKVVRFDSTNQKTVTDRYIKQDSTVLPTVDIANKQYNRYLPLKVSGAQFPIPDAEELKGKKIASVVVLAPVDSLQNIDDNDNRQERDIIESKHVKFIAGDILKQLLKKPTRENFRRWLDKESKTDIDLQSVVLLVAKDSDKDQEIFMYDISTKVVNRLNGELSTAFVNVAEDNASSDDIENAEISDSGIIEKMSPNSSSDPMENKDNDDTEAAGSSRHETVVKYSPRAGKLDENKDKNNNIFINSGYSSIQT